MEIPDVARPDVGPNHPPSGVADPRDGSTSYDLLTGAAQLGARIWLERRLHRTVGAWAAEAVDPERVVAFDRVAMHHGWRAEVLFERLPQLRELPTSVLVRRPDPDVVAVTDVLAGATTDDERVLAWSAVAAALVDAHRRHLARTTPIADGPLRRWLPTVLRSLEEDISALRSLLPT